MSEVTLTQAAGIVDKERSTVFQWIERDLLPARKEGLGRHIHIDIDDLRQFAYRYNYTFNEQLAAQYTGQVKA